MTDFQRILVCLDLSEHDEILIKMCAFLVENMGTERIDFLHVVEKLELPEELLQKYPDLAIPVDESVGAFIKESITKVSKLDLPYEIHVVDGNPTDKILKWSNTKNVDLIVMGKKHSQVSSGILPEKIVKVSHCSMLLMPQTKRNSIDKIFVPLDFTDNSKHAIEFAVKFADIYGAEVSSHHVYRVPSGYHTTGKSFEEFREIMEVHVRDEYNKFLKKNNLPDIPCIFSLDTHNNSVKVSFEKAQSDNYDLIVMGSKGRTGLASILLGSMAMRMIRVDLDIPLLIIKEKGENMGFLEALLKV